MANNNEFVLHIHTPVKIFYDDKAEELIIHAMHGSMGIMYNTMPIVTVINKCRAKIRAKNKWMELTVGDGFMEVRNNVVNVFVSDCAWGYESLREVTIDEESDELQNHKNSIKEHQLAKAQLVRQLARLQVKTYDK